MSKTKQNTTTQSKTTRFILCGCLVLIGIVLYIVGAIVLPTSIGLQIQMDGTLSNHVNKYIGLIIPLGLTVGGSAVFCLKESKKALLFAALGIVVYGVTFWANL